MLESIQSSEKKDKKKKKRMMLQALFVTAVFFCQNVYY